MTKLGSDVGRVSSYVLTVRDSVASCSNWRLFFFLKHAAVSIVRFEMCIQPLWPAMSCVDDEYLYAFLWAVHSHTYLSSRNLHLLHYKMNLFSVQLGFAPEVLGQVCLFLTLYIV